ncbi:MAG: glycosyltransferase family 2 protein [Salinivirgaceae bacterium]
MDVSIIIINYNTFELTRRCIQSVIDKTTEINYELILVDNASNEKNPDEFLFLFPNINLIKSPVNLGFAGGNNLGISQAKGRVILLLNSDTELINNAIKICFDRLNSDNSIGIISSALYNYNESLQKQCNFQESIWRSGFELLRLHKVLSKTARGRVLQGAYCEHIKPMYTDKVWGTFFMFRRDLLNGFPQKKLHDDYFMYGEDVQWCYFVRNVLKMKILYYPEAKIYHLGGGSDFKEDKAKIQLQNRYKTLVAYHSPLYLIIFGWMKWLVQVIEEKKNAEPQEVSTLIWRIFIKKEIN